MFSTPLPYHQPEDSRLAPIIYSAPVVSETTVGDDYGMLASHDHNNTRVKKETRPPNKGEVQFPRILRRPCDWNYTFTNTHAFSEIKIQVQRHRTQSTTVLKKEEIGISRHNKCRYKKVFGLNWRLIMISKAVAELGQRFRVGNALWIRPSLYSRKF
ncbi:hypothetical protein TNCV_1676131 [Trichonephila clavipes]|nr:hypothetical protein TNCV_1676131 [Trichonephila clavipes]